MPLQRAEVPVLRAVAVLPAEAGEPLFSEYLTGSAAEPAVRSAAGPEPVPARTAHQSPHDGQLQSSAYNLPAILPDPGLQELPEPPVLPEPEALQALPDS